MISCLQGKSDMDLFTVKAKTVLQTERNEFLQDYLLLPKMSPGQEGLNNSLQYYEGINGFIEQPAINPPKLEDFFVEFDNLVNDWKMETLIGQEDGRPFAYEVDHKFMDAIYDQCVELTMVPYDAIASTEDLSGDGSTNSNGIGGYSGNIGLESSIMTLATISGAASKSFAKGKMPKLKSADWLHLNDLKPNFDQFLTRNRQIVDGVRVSDLVI
jgi:hypothetical protein